ncbi:adult-specific rigid cuticular protein 15.7-like [Tachypleus tridentatus]|uniref:adult-specific rigid cuticular protein 15.7-like n=1 Tax=Tachypleus tridentatus TaxID=6853 RepID=UPI003FD45DE8
MIVKIATFFALLVVVRGGLYHGLAGGSSISSRRQDDFGNYAFNYDIVDPLGATNGRWEAGDGYGNKRGAYSLTDIDGRARRVEYVADGAGFRAVVKTNEPGTAASAPAAAVVASSQPGVVTHGPAVVKAHVTAASAYAYGNPVHVAGIYRAPVYGAGFLKYH